MARLLSVNVGLPRDIEWQGKTVHTERSIFDAVEAAPCARPVVSYINDISNWLL